MAAIERAEIAEPFDRQRIAIGFVRPAVTAACQIDKLLGSIGAVLGSLLVGGLFALNWTVSSTFMIAIIPPIISAGAVLIPGSTLARRPGGERRFAVIVVG
ncbi:MAG TPA: hypothetical protein VGF92_02380 [Stellaceae bacterium]|jgi:hypothetical protein